MRTELLVAAAVFLPLLWGWSVHWLLDRFWPVQEVARNGQPRAATSREHPVDYQI
jgi:hypothetical protein